MVSCVSCVILAYWYLYDSCITTRITLLYFVLPTVYQLVSWLEGRIASQYSKLENRNSDQTYEHKRNLHVMGWPTYLFLRVLHILYSLYLYFSSRRRQSTNHPSPSLTTPRQKTPKHLAI